MPKHWSLNGSRVSTCKLKSATKDQLKLRGIGIVMVVKRIKTIVFIKFSSAASMKRLKILLISLVVESAESNRLGLAFSLW